MLSQGALTTHFTSRMLCGKLSIPSSLCPQPTQVSEHDLSVLPAANVMSEGCEVMPLGLPPKQFLAAAGRSVAPAERQTYFPFSSFFFTIVRAAICLVCFEKRTAQTERKDIQPSGCPCRCEAKASRTHFPANKQANSLIGSAITNLLEASRHIFRPRARPRPHAGHCHPLGHALAHAPCAGARHMDRPSELRLDGRRSFLRPERISHRLATSASLYPRQPALDRRLLYAARLSRAAGLPHRSAFLFRHPRISRSARTLTCLAISHLHGEFPYRLSE